MKQNTSIEKMRIRNYLHSFEADEMLNFHIDPEIASKLNIFRSVET